MKVQNIMKTNIFSNSEWNLFKNESVIFILVNLKLESQADIVFNKIIKLSEL